MAGSTAPAGSAPASTLAGLSSSDVSASAVPDIEFLTTEELHRTLLRLYRLGNRVRHKFVLGLLEMSHRNPALGAPSLAAYASEYFQMSPTQTNESLRVAEKLLGLPRTRRAFDQGEVSWSHLIELTRVAETATEEAWLACARKHPVNRFRLEVQDAVQHGRKLPREDDYGLPQARLPWKIEASLEQLDIIEKACAKIAGEIRIRLGPDAGPVTRLDCFLFMCLGYLESDPEGTPKGRTEAEGSLYQVLLALCPSCKCAYQHTDHGPVEVEFDKVIRVMAEARRVVIRPEEEREVKGEALIEGKDGECCAHGDCGQHGGHGKPEKDRKNPPSLVRKVLARDGHRCANPHCRKKLGLHAHHLVFRENGGPTVLYNLVACCKWCHGLVHAGVLEVYQDAQGNLRWVSRGSRIRLDPEPEQEELKALPAVVVQAPVAAPPPAAEAGAAAAAPTVPAESPASPEPMVSPAPSFFVAPAAPVPSPEKDKAATPADPTRRRVPEMPAQVFKMCTRGLQRLGFEKEVSRERVTQAWCDLQARGRLFKLEDLVVAAIAGRVNAPAAADPTSGVGAPPPPPPPEAGAKSS